MKLAILASLFGTVAIAASAAYRATPAAVVGAPAPVQSGFNVGSTGVDGALVVFNGPAEWDAVIDLGDPDASWDLGGHQPQGTNTTCGGAYVATDWMVVFHYTNVDIKPGAKVQFKNHPSRAPVVWLVQGDVKIDGTVSLSGKIGGDGSVAGVAVWGFSAEPGPGGFRGGRNTSQGHLDDTGSGFGPGGAIRPHNFGGGYVNGSGASHAELGKVGAGWGGGGGDLGFEYGNELVTQLIGGSGGAAPTTASFATKVGGGGAGGGAILIASNGATLISGVIDANGGNGGNTNNGNAAYPGGGSGGAIRVVASSVRLFPTARVSALGGNGAGQGAVGRIRFEAPGFYLNTSLVQLDIDSTPFASVGEAGAILPQSQHPRISIVSVNNVAAPSDPRGGTGTGGLYGDVVLGTGGMHVVQVEGENVGPDWLVYLHAARYSGRGSAVLGPFALDPVTLSADIQVQLDPGYTVLQARVVAP
jgi:hypothetical protein